MKKKLVILLIPFLLTGCVSANYDLEIDKNLNVKEDAFVSATSNYFKNFYKNYPKTIVMQWYQDEEILKSLNDNNYHHELITEDVYYPGVSISKKYNSLSDYTNNMIFKNQVFEDIVSITTDNLITIKTIGFIPYKEDETVGYPISNLAINIKVPYVVVNHNADKHDKKTNTYTWYINAETEDKEINLTFDKNKIYVYNLVMYISISILILLLIILVFVFRNVVKKGKLNNRVSE